MSFHSQHRMKEQTVYYYDDIVVKFPKDLKKYDDYKNII